MQNVRLFEKKVLSLHAETCVQTYAYVLAPLKWITKINDFNMKNVFKYLLIVSVVMVASSCNKRELNTRVSNTTGWNYFDQKTTNFQANEGVGNVNPIGMVPIQGGTFTVGEKDEFITAPRNNETRSLTVSSFYMDKYEVTNLNWNEYLHWLEFVFGAVAPELVDQARPDHKVWREDLAYNDPYEDNYFEHPAFSFYPVVGVSWEQANGILPMAYRPCE